MTDDLRRFATEAAAFWKQEACCLSDLASAELAATPPALSVSLGGPAADQSDAEWLGARDRSLSAHFSKHYTSKAPALYLIEAPPELAAALWSASLAFRARGGAKEVALARHNNNHEGSCTIYVGSTRSPLARLRQHLLSKGSPRTSSLHLPHWTRGIAGEITIKLFPWPPERDLQRLATVEEVLWRSRKPLFGRCGIL